VLYRLHWVSQRNLWVFCLFYQLYFKPHHPSMIQSRLMWQKNLEIMLLALVINDPPPQSSSHTSNSNCASKHRHMGEREREKIDHPQCSNDAIKSYTSCWVILIDSCVCFQWIMLRFRAYGFQFHHAEGQGSSLLLWLGKGPCKVIFTYKLLVILLYNF
jgi:hypothetical protein